MKPALRFGRFGFEDASLPGNGERGLKPMNSGGKSDAFWASLPGNGERGLKPESANIDPAVYTASLPGNGERGLKHAVRHARALSACGFAPRQRGAWIETNLPWI